MAEIANIDSGAGKTPRAASKVDGHDGEFETGPRAAFEAAEASATYFNARRDRRGGQAQAAESRDVDSGCGKAAEKGNERRDRARAQVVFL